MYVSMGGRGADERERELNLGECNHSGKKGSAWGDMEVELTGFYK